MSAVQVPENIISKPLTLHDIEAIMHIEQRAYDYPWSAGIFADCLHVGYSSWGLWQGCELLGYCIMSMVVEDAHILNLCIDPDHHGRGYGRQLLEHMLNLAAERKASRVLLEVRPSNISARALYRRLGFMQIGIRRRYYPARNGREDALVLVKKLI